MSELKKSFSTTLKVGEYCDIFMSGAVIDDWPGWRLVMTEDGLSMHCLPDAERRSRSPVVEGDSK